MSNMNFNNLVDYLGWRTSKRVEYRQLSHKLRILKREIRATMQAGGYAGEMQTSLIGVKADARQMMEDRLTAKQIARDAWEQWRGERRERAA